MRSAGHLRQRSGDRSSDRRARSGSVERQWRRGSDPQLVGGLPQGSYNGFKMAVAVIVFHFGVKMLVQFADILLPFIMALLLVTVLEPVKQMTLEVLEGTLLLIFTKLTCCRCCIRVTRKGVAYGDYAESVARQGRVELNEVMKRLCLLCSIILTILLAGRLFWLIGRIVWLSGSAVSEDLGFYQEGVRKRSAQVQALLVRFHLEKNIQLDTEHLGNYCLSGIKYVAEFLSQHVFYTVTQVSLTTIFVLFLLFSPVQRDLSPVMQGVFGSMELYLKLKTFISLMMGITNGIALAVIGLEVPAAWGLLTFLANFIPNIGGPVVSLVPCLISILDARKTFAQVSAAFLAQFFLHFNIANFVEPVVFGTTEEIHSVVVLLGLSFFGYIWGFTGMFLSVPLLFAMHAWLDTVARTQTYHQEAREDARFIMGMLEGRWLADSAQDVGEKGNQNDVNLLTGHIEEADEEGRPIEMPSAREQDRSTSGPVGATHSSESKQQPMIEWDLCRDMKDMLAVRDPTTGEVRAVALLLRWIFLAGMFTFIFFGFSIFHWHLHYLIHPSGGSQANTTHFATVVGDLSTSKAQGKGLLFTTTLASTATEVETATAVPAFPFSGSPQLDGASGVSIRHDAKGLHVGALSVHGRSFDLASSGSGASTKTNRSSSDTASPMTPIHNETSADSHPLLRQHPHIEASVELPSRKDHEELERGAAQPTTSRHHLETRRPAAPAGKRDEGEEGDDVTSHEKDAPGEVESLLKHHRAARVPDTDTAGTNSSHKDMEEVAQLSHAAREESDDHAQPHSGDIIL